MMKVSFLTILKVFEVHYSVKIKTNFVTFKAYQHFWGYCFVVIACQPLTLDGQSRALIMQIFVQLIFKEKMIKLLLELFSRTLM